MIEFKPPSDGSGLGLLAQSEGSKGLTDPLLTLSRVDHRRFNFLREAISDGWSASGSFRLTDDHGLVIEALAVLPHPTDRDIGAGVNARVLRESIPLSTLRAGLAAEIRERDRRRVAGYERTFNRPAEGRLRTDNAVPRRRTGRPPRDEADLRDVAIDYLQCVGGRGLYERLMKRRPYTSREALRDQIKAARNRGWLGPVTRGQQGTEAGPKLLEYWDNEREHSS